MAKAASTLVQLVSTAKTGYFVVRSKNAKKKPEKMEMKKYDPIVRKHVIFKETKLK